MDTANKRQRQEQLKRYYAREKNNVSTITKRQSKPVVTIKDSARLRDAASRNLLEELSSLLLHKTSKISREDINEAFLKACINGHIEVARLLLENQAFVDYQDQDLWAGIHFASTRGNKALLSLLFEYNVDTTLLDVDGNFALDYALDDTVKQLIAEEMAQSGVYPEDLPSIRTRQLKAMTAAVRSGITRGKDMTQFNKNGVTPLHTAAAYGYYEVTQLLVESSKVPLSIVDSFGCTPLEVAMKYGQTQVVKYLLQQGARMEENPYEIGGSGLNLEALAGRNSPQPLSNKWKLKDITSDDTQRERSWLSQHIGLIQDIPPPPLPPSLPSSSLPPSLPSSSLPPSLPSSSLPSSSLPPREENLYNSLEDLNLAGPSTNHTHTATPYNRRKGSAPVITSLRPIPEHTHTHHTIVTTPTISNVIEDIYDYGRGTPPAGYSSPIPAHMSIYDDSVVATVLNNNNNDNNDNNDNNGEDIYDDLRSVDTHERNEDLYDDIRSVTVGVAQGCNQQPCPYEEFVSVHSKAPPIPPPEKPLRPGLNQMHSDSDLYSMRGHFPPQPPKRPTQRSQSVDDQIPEAWLSRMHPQLRKAYAPVPPLRRDSTPNKAPPPVPNRVGGGVKMPPPQPPPRNYAQPRPPVVQPRPIQDRHLPSHPIDVPPAYQSNDYQLPPHLIEQALAPPHPPPTHLIDYAMVPPYSPPTQQPLVPPHPPPIQTIKHPIPPRSPITRMASAPTLPSAPILDHTPSDPPPSYATVLHSPEQFSSTPILTPPTTRPHPPPRRIASIPDSLTDHVMYLGGSEGKKERNVMSAKPYTFRTKFQ